MQTLLGKKIGMTQVFDDEGRQVPVTVIEVGPCIVVQKKTRETDGYDAVQLGFGEQKAQRLTRPMLGHYKKTDTNPARVLREVRVDTGAEIEEGQSFTASVFDGVEYVDISGVTKGRGFQGVVKRWNMGGGRASHGGHGLRRIGSIGMCVDPARVLRGRKNSGQMGNKNRTTQNLKVVQVREDDNVILVRGSVPGPNGGYVTVRKALKKGA